MAEKNIHDTRRGLINMPTIVGEERERLKKRYHEIKEIERYRNKVFGEILTWMQNHEAIRNTYKS